MANNNLSSPQPREERIIWRDIDTLLLDPENPRIFIEPAASQLEILKLLFTNEALEELALSLVRNGYFHEEPVVVVPAAEEQNLFTVVEGNRRVATVKILLDANLRRQLRVTEWPSPPKARLDELWTIPTVLYQSRDDVVSYLGFRHITGIKTWDTFAMARYVSRLIETGLSIAEVEEVIGDSAGTVKKLYQAFVTYRQITSDLQMEGKPVETNFSLLEVALGLQPIKQYLGIGRTLPTHPIQEVVPNNKLENLREVVSWVFGEPQEGRERVITDSREIGRVLAPVVADTEALAYLQAHRDLHGAYEYSGGEQQSLLRQLQAARRAAQRALGILPLHADDPEVKAERERLKTIVDALMSHARP